jgi:CubicO group peptidase (beta-lactamase class C family)
MELVNTFMTQAITDNVFPGAVLCVSHQGSIVFAKAYGCANVFTQSKMTRDTIFDLASLTKPLATTLAIMMLIQRNQLDLEQPLGSLLHRFKDSAKGPIKIKHLLRHNSGLPDYRPYYKILAPLESQLRKDALKDLLLEEPLIQPIAKGVLYSDLGFMILRWVIETVSGQRLDHFVDQMIYQPLGIENLFFVDLDSESRKGQFAATERCPWRKVLLEGAVHDENAYIVGGIDGHSGLFGTADDLHILLKVLLAAFQGQTGRHLINKDLVQRFFERDDETGRALGFDTPSLSRSSTGKYFSKKSVGHLGFTGTSFWIDLERSVAVILLTNRVHPTRDNEKIRDFRPQIHDAVMRFFPHKMDR